VNEREEISPRLWDITRRYDMVDYVMNHGETEDTYRARLATELADPMRWIEVATALFDEIRDNFQVRAGRIDIVVELLRHSPAIADPPFPSFAEFHRLARDCQRLDADVTPAFAEMIRLNDALRSKGDTVTYGRVEGGAVRAYYASPAGEAFSVGAVRVEACVEHDAALGEEIEKAHELWREKAIAAGSAKQAFDAAIERLRVALTPPPAARPAGS
jgi:hypothetical protein